MKYVLVFLLICAIADLAYSKEKCKVTAMCMVRGKDTSTCKLLPNFKDWDPSTSSGGGKPTGGSRYCNKGSGWTSGNNGYQYKIVSELANWEMAQKLCEYEGGTLPTKESFSSSAYGGFESFLRQNGHIYGFWLPMTDTAQEGQWRWLNGMRVTTTRWNGGQPDGSGDCAYINRDWGYNWDDGVCATSQFGVVCQK
uniref:perlucin-like protein n=1 Tax=Styela clava TaxID=7725 RepID=UPI001939D1EB|nr:perlucin-like protein [Styela clava]